MRLVKKYGVYIGGKWPKSARIPQNMSDVLDRVSQWLSEVAGLAQPITQVPASERGKAAAAEERWRKEVLEQAHLLDDPSIMTTVRQLVGWPLIPGEAEEQLRNEQNQFLYDVGERDPDKFQAPARQPAAPAQPGDREKAIQQQEKMRYNQGLRPGRSQQKQHQIESGVVPSNVSMPDRYGKRGA
jgi:hypothetical protein